MEQCPCGSGKVLARCCGPYIEGEAQPPTAEALMRARYTAYDLGESDYILDTHHPKGRKDLDREGTRQWAKETHFHSLEILDTKDGGEDDDEGEVEFVVRYDEKDGRLRTHHERSKFKKHKGKWYFTDGTVDVKGQEPIKRDQPKVGRNDPCPCGSGKKYKKCCLRTARA